MAKAPSNGGKKTGRNVLFPVEADRKTGKPIVLMCITLKWNLHFAKVSS